MKRPLRITGCAVLVIVGVVACAVVEPWPLVWLVCFPVAYAGGLGLYENIAGYKNESRR